MIILGVDPGATTGWCAYDIGPNLKWYPETIEQHRVVGAGRFPGHDFDQPFMDAIDSLPREHAVVVERPKGYGPTRPQVVDCAYVCGRLVSDLEQWWSATPSLDVHELTRLDVKRRLREYHCGEVATTRDSDVWAALVLMHGEGSDRKERTKKKVVIEQAGVLGGITSHERAALAVAVAFLLPASPSR